MTFSGPYCWGGFSAAVIAETRPVANGMVPVKVFGGERFVELESNGATIEVECADQSCRSLTCGIDGLRDLYCWEALSPSANPPVLNPQRVAGAPKVASLSLGMTHGQLGDGTTVDKVSPTPVSTTIKFTSVTTGYLHTCAISDDRRAYCWGANNWGQLGNGTTSSSPIPVRVGGDLGST